MRRVNHQTLEAQIAAAKHYEGRWPDLLPGDACRTCGGGLQIVDRNAAGQSQILYSDTRYVTYCPACVPAMPELVKQEVEAAVQQRDRMNRCAHHRTFLRARHEGGAAIGRCYSHCYFSTFKPVHPSQGEARDQVIKWVSSPAAQQRYPFVLLCGEPGAGKTHLAVSAWRQFAKLGKNGGGGMVIPFRDDAELYAGWRQSLPAHDIQYTRDVSNLEMMIWDDIGKTVTDKWQSTMFAILNERMKSGRPTLFTSNYKPSALCQRLEPSLARRISCGLVFDVYKSQPAAAA
jgi:DNA replication protein DnaC